MYFFHGLGFALAFYWLFVYNIFVDVLKYLT